MPIGSFGDHLVNVNHPLPMPHGGLQSACISNDELAQTDPIVFHAKQASLIMALRERLQFPPSRSFCLEDLVWTNHMTSGKGKYKSFKLAIIFWDRLDDFIKGNNTILISPANTPKKL